MTEPSRGPRRHAGAILWVVVAGLAAALGLDVGGATVAPALVDVRSASLQSPTTARVARVLVRDGDEVKAGDVVVQLDTAEIDLELALAEAELVRVRGAVRARQVGVKDQDFEVGLRLQADLDKAALTVSTLQAELKQDEQELSSLGELVDKNEKLVKAQLAAGQGLDELKVRQAALRERVAAASEEQRAALRLKETAERRLGEWRARTGHEDALVAPDEAAVVSQEERVKQVRWRRERLTLRAPVAGRVAGLVVGEGDVVREGAPIASVIDTAPARATAWVGEESAWRVAPGDRVTMRSVDGRGLVRTGRVRALGGGIVEVPLRLRQIPGEPMFGRAVYIDLDPGPGVLPGQTFDASFASSSPSPLQPSSSPPASSSRP